MSEVLIALRLSVAFVFLLAAGAKVIRPVVFADALKVYVGASASIRYTSAAAVIAVEFLLAAGHLLGLDPVVILGSGIVTTTVFFGVVATRLASGKGGPCLCFGADHNETIGLPTLLRSGALLVAEIALFVDSRGATSSWALSPSEPSVTVLWAMCALVVSAWLLRYRDLFELFGRLRPAESKE